MTNKFQLPVHSITFTKSTFLPMKASSFIRRVLKCYFVGIAFSFIILLFTSWVMSIYVDGVEGLLTARGIRWMCSNIVPNFAAVSLAKRLMELMALSVLLESGIFQAAHGHISLKQKRAFQITGISTLVIVGLFSLLLLLPNALLLSAFGTFRHSAFSKGLYGLLLCLAIFIGNVYGYTSGRFVKFHDFIHAHVSLFSRIGSYFVLLFMASQFVGCLEFTGMLDLMGGHETLLFVLKGVLYNIPLLLYLLLLL
ncbi:MAG: AbgT family transporter [Bacteroidaceae bacterium]|nr:AbgT family transporter [Bacteroidaceae bacterium]